MQALTPWPALVKRLRFLSSLKQDELAQQLGVDQATVSRWERGTYAPDIPVQKRLRDMLHRLEPIIGPAAVEAMSSSPRQSSEIAGFVQSTWYRFRGAGH